METTALSGYSCYAMVCLWNLSVATSRALLRIVCESLHFTNISVDTNVASRGSANRWRSIIVAGTVAT